MARKLINRVVIFIFLYFLLKINYNAFKHFSVCICDSNGFCTEGHWSHIFVFIELILGVVFILICYLIFLAGAFDRFLERKADPTLKKFCNWINRRNGTNC